MIVQCSCLPVKIDPGGGTEEYESLPFSFGLSASSAVGADAAELGSFGEMTCTTGMSGAREVSAAAGVCESDIV